MNREDFQETLQDHPFHFVNDLVYSTILKDIITIKLAPGEKVSHVKIANQLGVSRSPVRSAIERLEAEKLILRDENKCPYVAPLNREDYLAICEARKAIEGSAAFFASKRITNEEVTELKRVLKKMGELESSAVSNVDEMTSLDLQFHYTILEASRNYYIIEMYNRIKNRVQRYRYYQMYKYEHNLLPSEFFAINDREHYAILRAILSGLSTIARTEMESHIDNMRTYMV